MFDDDSEFFSLENLAEANERVRGFILDSQLPDPHRLCVLLGCSTISDDVAQKEEEESEKRVHKVLPMMPILQAQANAMARATIAYQKEALEDAPEVPATVWVTSHRMIASIALSAMLGSLSQLYDMNFIKLVKEKDNE